MSDYIGLVALVVAAVALVVTAVQLTQQLLATGYTIKKCDSIVTAGLFKGGTRQWHWRQFRFSVRYRALVFSLRPEIHRTLSLSPAIHIDAPNPGLFDKAITARPSRSSAQGCWVSFLEDLVHFSCVERGNVGLNDESGDRIPDDLTVAPTKVDAITVLLSSIAMGMQVFKYSPSSAEVGMNGGSGSISSSSHPVLGGLLHYSFFLNDPSIGSARARLHGQALCNEHGVWANAVFGRFRNRSFCPDFVPLRELLVLWKAPLDNAGWKDSSFLDRNGGAMSFLVFAYADCYKSVPPSVSRPYCAHFAESVIKIHHWHIVESMTKLAQSASSSVADIQPNLAQVFEESFYRQRDYFVQEYGCSSPFLPWEVQGFSFKFAGLESSAPYSEKASPSSTTSKLSYPNYLVCSGLLDDIWTLRKYGLNKESYKTNTKDPSTYLSTNTAWELILRCDEYMRFTSLFHRTVRPLAEQIATHRIVYWAELGIPSWKNAAYHAAFDKWDQEWEEASTKVFNAAGEMPPEDIRDRALLYAFVMILRAAYYTVMMRSAHELGPGLTETGNIENALLHMA